MESLALARGLAWKELTLSEKEALWQQAKTRGP
jgi:hypothetical protein